jgi:hypothetical protein
VGRRHGGHYPPRARSRESGDQPVEASRERTVNGSVPRDSWLLGAGFIKRLEEVRKKNLRSPPIHHHSRRLEIKSRVEWEALAWQLRRLAAQVVAAIAARPCGAGALAAEADTKLDSDDEAGALV